MTRPEILLLARDLCNQWARGERQEAIDRLAALGTLEACLVYHEMGWLLFCWEANDIPLLKAVIDRVEGKTKTEGAK